MTPAPNLQELIEIVQQDSPSQDLLDLLITASSTVAQLEEVNDALLGHFVDRCRRNGHSWSEISSALGVSKQAAHKRFSLNSPNLTRFTLRAREAIETTSEVARSLGHDHVGTEHLLLAMFADPGTIAAKALARLHVERHVVEARILAEAPRGPDESSAVTPYTPKAVEALQGSVAEALQLGHNYIGTEHMLLALFRDPDTLAARVLADLHIDHAMAKAQVVELLSGFLANPKRPPAG